MVLFWNSLNNPVLSTDEAKKQTKTSYTKLFRQKVFFLQRLCNLSLSNYCTHRKLKVSVKCVLGRFMHGKKSGLHLMRDGVLWSPSNCKGQLFITKKQILGSSTLLWLKVFVVSSHLYGGNLSSLFSWTFGHIIS